MRYTTYSVVLLALYKTSVSVIIVNDTIFRLYEPGGGQDGHDRHVASMTFKQVIPFFNAVLHAERKELSQSRKRGGDSTLEEALMYYHYQDMYFDNHFKSVCPYFKTGYNVYMPNMVGTWNLAFHQLRTRRQIICYSLRIIGLTYKERDYFAYKFRKFRRQVNWNNIYLQIVITNTTKPVRFHFLHSKPGYRGVLDNVIFEEIIDEEESDKDDVRKRRSVDEAEKKYLRKRRSIGQQGFNLLAHSEDQWQAYDNVLAMKSCQTDEALLFGKGYYKLPSNHAPHYLRSLGKINAKGTMVCLSAPKVDLEAD